MNLTLAEISVSNQYLLYALVGVTLIYAVFVRPMMRQKKDPLARTPARNSLAQQRNVERQMETLLVELSGMARQITAQLDTRATKLEMLLKEADEKLALLRAALAKPQSTDAKEIAPSPTISQPNMEISRVAQTPWENSDALPAVADAKLAPDIPTEPPSPPRPSSDSKYANIYELADAGFSSAEIARELSKPVGEIDLILSLRRRAKTTAV